ncbi:MAG: RagB/SusD family nutrient uptake outer membrane protein [Bacteroidales bacterium]
MLLKKPMSILIGAVLLSIPLLNSCEKFIDPEQELILKADEIYTDWDEYRSAGLGLYALQQDLVEQILVLGELRGDLLQVTENATPELIEVYNFNIQKDNPYASPKNFYKLISACNKLIRQLESAYPDVLDKNKPINNFDRLYGEVLCMRAWAYFNAVRIYQKVPYIHDDLTDVEEIENYVNSESSYTVPFYINYAPDGYYNDTIRDTTIVLTKQFLDQKAVIDTFTVQLKNNIKAIGVNHSINNGDVTWLVTVWNDYARHALLGQMYLFDGNYTSAIKHFTPILYNNTSETSEIRFGLDAKFSEGNWKNIFRGVEPYEHIFTLWFGKSFQQTNGIQSMFSILPPNNYMMKPTESSIKYWESIWNDPKVQLYNNDPTRSKVTDPGIPGDFNRGYGVSYKFYKYGKEMSVDTIAGMLIKKLTGRNLDVQLMMQDVDTVISKYSIGRNEYAHDAHFLIFRAAGIHLYAAEIYALWVFDHSGIIRPETNTSLNILNNGSYTIGKQRGVRGRVGFADGYESVQIPNIIYIHDPITNEIVGYYDYTGNLPKKQEYLIERIIEERARELAFEGERFYDLVRIAKRRNDPSYLADKVAAKFSGAEKEAIYQKLLDEQNWYIHYFD